VVWGITGPLFHYSENWQLVITTGTTIVTFVMVFLIQQSKNKDSVALHLKLNEVISSHRSASDKLIGIEEASDDELRRLAAAYLRVASGEDRARSTYGKSSDNVDHEDGRLRQFSMHFVARRAGRVNDCQVPR
jgi:low affinity Fe/Cu permease